MEQTEVYLVPISKLFGDTILFDTNKKAALQKRYQAALSCYRYNVSLPPSFQFPLFLNNPFAFFCLKKVHGSMELFCNFPIPYNMQGHCIRHVTERTFYHLFEAHNLRCADPNTMQELFSALKSMITEYPYLKVETLFMELTRKNPWITDSILNLLYLYRGNFYIQDVSKPFPLFLYRPILTMDKSELPSGISTQMFKRFLSEVPNIVKLSQIKKTDISSYPKNQYILYRDSGLSNFQMISRSSYGNTYDSCNLMSLVLPEKFLNQITYPSDVPRDTITVLYHLTGGDLNLLDQLSHLMANAASTVPTCKKRATIICTRINLVNVIRLLCATFNWAIFAPQLDINETVATTAPLELEENEIVELKSSFSANKFCSQRGLRLLFQLQSTGKNAVIVNDTPISDRNLPTFKKIIAGEKVTIKSVEFPKQYLYNTTHFIFVSDNPKRAKLLQASLKCDFIDLTNKEMKVPFFTLTKDETGWLRMVFLPYGLITPKNRTEAHNTAEASDGLEDFIKNWCKKDSDAKSSREDLYRAYVDYYHYSHLEKKPKLTIGRFVKAVNALIKNDPQISYKKLRSTQSRYFIGISCLTDFSAITEPNLPNINSFLDYLEQINKTSIPLPNLNQRIAPRENKLGVKVVKRKVANPEEEK